ncbi:hypothetical protein G6F42_026540 [Rhizopus arrhizus]|nr:hypothetical protein G6F42_026540 [Rhizopus arrhizus]
MKLSVSANLSSLSSSRPSNVPNISASKRIKGIASTSNKVLSATHSNNLKRDVLDHLPSHSVEPSGGLIYSRSSRSSLAAWLSVPIKPCFCSRSWYVPFRRRRTSKQSSLCFRAATSVLESIGITEEPEDEMLHIDSEQQAMI